MYLKSIELSGFKSFARKTTLDFSSSITAVVGPNGSGKSNIVEGFRFVLGEQSHKRMRSRRGEDLIFGGSSTASRANRASIAVTLDNRDRRLNLDFDEVRIERVVHRDGVNHYLLNGSQVRLRDVIELLSAANIGPTGHHIISQGEADRVLVAHPRERREMIEDALGLKAYQYKKTESQKKLEQTRQNITQVESLRRELAPHLRFLKKQVEKVERSLQLKAELADLLRDYLKRESVYIAYWKERCARERAAPAEELGELERALDDARARLRASETRDETSEAVLAIERELQELQKEREANTRSLGRVEGELAGIERARTDMGAEGAATHVPRAALDELAQTADAALAEAKETGTFDGALRALAMLRDTITRLMAAPHADTKTSSSEEAYEQLIHERDELSGNLEELAEREKSARLRYEEARRRIEAGQLEGREAEREIFTITTKQSELRAALARADARLVELTRDEEELAREIQEGIALVGGAMREYKAHTPSGEEGALLSDEQIATETRDAQRARRNAIERLKVRLDEVGGGSGEEIVREYEEAKERDAFLERELADLGAAAEKLVSLISELEEKLDSQFKSGLTHINKEFQAFFEVLFGGGSAGLSLVELRSHAGADTDDAEREEEDAAIEEGIELDVSLPHKRIKGLQALSGGERALTSIALIFAMSQVNPPPFIILDETDAALDEANARKYGEMVQRLAEKSQLVLVTHNRETMGHASVLYGVTMGADAVSRILSVRLEDAQAAAAR